MSVSASHIPGQTGFSHDHKGRLIHLITVWTALRHQPYKLSYNATSWTRGSSSKCELTTAISISNVRGRMRIGNVNFNSIYGFFSKKNRRDTMTNWNGLWAIYSASHSSRRRLLRYISVYKCVWLINHRLLDLRRRTSNNELSSEIGARNSPRSSLAGEGWHNWWMCSMIGMGKTRQWMTPMRHYKTRHVELLVICASSSIFKITHKAGCSSDKRGAGGGPWRQLSFFLCTEYATRGYLARKETNAV